MKNLKITLILVSLLISAIIHSQNTYYIKNGGNNSNDGLTDETAWADITKISTYTGFSEGDIIYLKRGSVWDQQHITLRGLTASRPGHIPNNFTITAYGTGAKPKIISDGVAQIDGAIDVENVSDLTISYLDLSAPKATYVMRLHAANRATVDSCEIHHNSLERNGHGIVTFVPGSNRQTGENYYTYDITRNHFHHLCMEAFYGGVNGDPDNTGDIAEFAYNLIHDINLGNYNGGGDCVQFNLWASDMHIHHNVFDHRNGYRGGKGCVVISQEHGESNTIIEHNEFYGMEGDTFGCSVGRAKGTIVRYNYFHSEYSSGQAIGGSFSEAYGNVIIGYGTCFYLGVSPNEYKIYNNYLAPSELLSATTLLRMDGDDVNTIHFYNNICKKRNFRWGGTPEENRFMDHNLYKASKPSNSNEEHSIYVTDTYWEQDLFINDSYKIKGSSVAVDAGTDKGILKDKFGNDIPYNNIPDIGINEYTINSPNLYSITIKVTDGTNPIEGAKVSLQHLTKETNMQGEVVFSNLDSGNYGYFVIADGFYKEEKQLNLSNLNITAECKLQAAKYYNAYLKVVDESDNPLPNANVVFNNNQLITDETGSVTISNILAGRVYDCNLSYSGLMNKRAAFIVSDSDVHETIVLATDKTITFSITDGTNPIAGARVRFEIPKKGLVPRSVMSPRSNSAGIVSFNRLEKGTYNYSVTCEGYNSISNTNVELLLENKTVHIVLESDIPTNLESDIYINDKTKNINTISIYPNPTKGNIKISCKSNIKKVKTYNLLGKCLQSKDFNSRKIQLNLKSLPKGFYLIEITTEDEIFKRQIRLTN